MLEKPTNVSEFFNFFLKVLSYLALILGPFFFSAGAWLYYSAEGLSGNAVEVEALVIAVEERRGDSGTVYRPTFEAEMSNGDHVQYTGNTWVAPKPHEPGDTVSAYYDEASGIIRSRAMLEQFQFIGRIFMAIGGIIAILGVGAWVRRRFFAKKLD
ncbi:DUF3592 domain-containing protein [Celeribacter sp.]|uniref:DUF3592 domain-containing protein n=1 Tax=Celeribacter sp. TaxID=1890673 RepID=UPI003A8E90AE